MLDSQTFKIQEMEKVPEKELPARQKEKQDIDPQGHATYMFLLLSQKLPSGLLKIILCSYSPVFITIKKKNLCPGQCGSAG